MASRSKAKGNAFEREVVEAAKLFGLEAKRAWGSNGASMGEAEEVDVLIEGIRVQCKRRAALPAYLQIPEGCDVVVVRQDRGDCLVLLPLEEYLRCLKMLAETAT